MKLRPAVAADAAAIAEIHMSARRVAMPYLPHHLHTDDENRAWIAGIIGDPPDGWWVACQDAQVIGYMRLEGEHLDQLYVQPDAQGKGAGSLLLRHAMSLRARLRLYTFQRNTRARAFYEARGFQVVGMGDGSQNEENEPDVEYAWPA